ncbi:MAG: glycosyltransferase family 4 protein [Bacillota bacterium]
MPVIRVLHLLRPSGGGIRKHLLSLIGESDRKLFEHMVVCPTEELAGDFAGAGIQSVYLPMRGDLSLPADIRLIKKLVPLIRSSGADIVHAQGAKAGLVGRLAARLAGVDFVVMTVHGSLFFQGRSGPAKGLFAAGERFLAGFTDRIITVSKHLAGEIVQRERISPEKIVTIYNGVSPGEYSHYPGRDYLFDSTGNIPRRKFVAATAARLAPQKGVDIFIRAAAELSRRRDDIVFLVIGDGPLRSGLETMSRELGLKDRLFFTGYRKDMNRIMPCLDVFVLASVSEGMPLAVLEAMASGRPVIASRVGGIPEVIDDGVNGLLVSPGDVTGLVRAVERVIDDGKMAESMGEEGRRLVMRNFTVSKMASETEKVYIELVCAGSGRRPEPAGKRDAG